MPKNPRWIPLVGAHAVTGYTCPVGRRFLLPLVLPPLCAWGALLALDRVLVVRDLGATHIPWRQVWAGQVRAGRLPLWNPDANGGRLLWADPNAQAAYPPTLLFLLLPAAKAMVVFQAAHHLWLCLGFFQLARRWGVQPTAAALAAALAGNLGIVWSLATFPNALASFSWLPWMLSSLKPGVSHRQEQEYRAALAGGLLGVAFLAGEPVTAALGAGAALVASLVFWHRVPSPLPMAAVLVAAPVLVPLALAYPHTVRGHLGVAPGALAADCFAPRRWLELFFPRLLGEAWGDSESGFWAAGSFPWMRYYPWIFLGAAPLLLLCFAARPKTTPGRVAWALFAGGLALAALSCFLEPVLRPLPGVAALRYGIKGLQLSLLALPLLCGWGYEAWKERGARRAAVFLAGFFCLLAVFSEPWRGLLARCYPASADALAQVPREKFAAWLRWDGITNAAPLLALLLPAPAATAAVAGFFAVQFLPALAPVPTNAWEASPPIARSLPPGTAVACFAKSTAWKTPADDAIRARFFSFRDALVPDFGIAFGLRYVLGRGPDGLEALQGELLAAYGEKLAPPEQLRLAAALGAQAVVLSTPVPGSRCEAHQGVFLCFPAAPAPFAYLARRLLPVTSFEEGAAWLASEGFRPGEDVVVFGAFSLVVAAGGQVVPLPSTPHRLRFRTTAPRATMLVVQQSFFPGWRARVDGVPVAIQAGNLARLAVPVPAGEHLVELSLDPTPYWLGWVGLLLFGLLLGFTRRRVHPGPSGGQERSSQARGLAR